jgi:hypothetical protein
MNELYFLNNLCEIQVTSSAPCSSLFLVEHYHKDQVLHECSLHFPINLAFPYTFSLLLRILLTSLNFVFISRNANMALCSSVQQGETCCSYYNWPGDTRGSQAASPTVDPPIPLFSQYVGFEIEACARCAAVWEMCVWNKTVCRKNCIMAVVIYLKSKHLCLVNLFLLQNFIMKFIIH